MSALHGMDFRHNAVTPGQFAKYLAVALLTPAFLFGIGVAAKGIKLQKELLAQIAKYGEIL